MRATTYLTVVGLMCGAAPWAHAIDVPVASKKLIVVDKVALAGLAKVVYVAKDRVAGIAKGPSLALDQIDLAFDLSYLGVGSVTGGFVVPPGSFSETDGWKVNNTNVAKYVNNLAPAGPTGVKVAVVKPGKVLKLVGKIPGDLPFDIVTGGAPVGGVDTVFTVNNDGVTHRHCSYFPVCVHKAIGGGTGAKLVCKTGLPTACSGSGSTTTSTTMIVTTTVSSSSSSTSTITTTTSTAPSCSDGITNGDETDVDCGGPVCPTCPPGSDCLVSVDCDSSICTAFVCQAASCSDGVLNGDETDVDCGGSCPACPLGASCAAGTDCLSDYCSGGVCACANDSFVITANTIGDGPDFDLSQEWPDGPVTACTPGASECCVTVDRPGGNIDITEVGGDPWIFVSVAGFSSCSAAGDFCANNPVCNAPAAIPRCVIGRPSCSSALGSASHTVDIACLE